MIDKAITLNDVRYQFVCYSYIFAKKSVVFTAEAGKKQDLQRNHPNLGTKRICHSTLMKIETNFDVSGNNLPECAALGECLHEEIHRPRTARVDTENGLLLLL
jgi:hypothetical protein